MRKIARPLGRYHVLDRIAFGGMAEIFRALTFDENGNGRLLAIKQVLPHFTEDREFIDMIVDEAKLVSMLHHKNIVEIFEFGNIEDIYFLAMEFVWGKDLRSVLERCRARRTRIPFEVSAYLLAEALSGLDSSHRLLDPQGNPAGLVHRDFSPSNVLISYNGNVKICDYGIAKATFSRIETRTGVIKGKVKYMSPEQAYGHKLDHRSDVFSAGSVFYEMLTNDPPFLAKNEIDLIFLVRDAKAIPANQRVPDVPERLEAIVNTAMTRSRSTRYQSAGEFRYDLLNYLNQRGVGNWKAELARFMQSLYSKEISKERASLSEYTLDHSHIGGNYGQNLIADVMGNNAAYTKFNPFPTRFNASPNFNEVHDASTQMIDSPQDRPLNLAFAGPGEETGFIDDQSTLMIADPTHEATPSGQGQPSYSESQGPMDISQEETNTLPIFEEPQIDSKFSPDDPRIHSDETIQTQVATPHKNTPNFNVNSDLPKKK